VLDYGYNSGLDDTISRVSYEADDGGSSSGVHLADYSYLGLGTIVVQNEPENNTELTYVHQTGDTLSSSDGGDQYTGLDRFGRVIDQYWLNTSTSTASDRLQYGYDRDGNVLYEKNLVNASFSELYHANSSTTGDNNTAYDPLNRLTTFRRGSLTSSGNNGSSLDTITSGNLNTTTSVGHTDSWNLDALGNWSSSAPNGSSSTDAFNSKNEETTNGSHTLTFDANGNMTTDEQGQQYVFDAWNHPVQIKNSGGTTIETFSNDATGHVIIENNGAGDDHWYYSDTGQVVEEKYSSSYDQFVWGLGYINDLILRDRNADGNGATGDLGLTGSGLEERYYAQHDASWSTISITGQTGTLVYRYVYDPYGSVVSLDPSTWTYSGPGTTYWLYLFQGMRVDGTMYFSQSRWYDPALGRWNRQDPAGYVDGMNLYKAYSDNAATKVDYSGLAAASTQPTQGDTVTAKFDPDHVDSIPWADALLNPVKRADQNVVVGQTTTTVDITTGAVKNKECWLPTINISLKQQIYLDTTAQDAADLPGSYGHEQLHVRNNMNIVKSEKNDYNGQIKQHGKFTSEQQAKDFAESLAKLLKDTLDRMMNEDATHSLYADPKNNGGPKKDGAYPPIGTMPGTPTTQPITGLKSTSTIVPTPPATK
jgi:RHS repeat-associated protein